jgi:hypothetical protein
MPISVERPVARFIDKLVLLWPTLDGVCLEYVKGLSIYKIGLPRDSLLVVITSLKASLLFAVRSTVLIGYEPK